ncbi:MAG: YoaP domain-containing protein [Prevotella sp.]|nr:YoaP domain-containing protein [Prevotella sp.]
MEIITITKENLNNEHICCAISNKDDIQVTSKKSWIAERLDDGLVFKKGDVRGKCFIEYIPAEKAWAPIEAAGYMYIDCLWVSGQFKGQGNSSILLEECIRDSKEKGKKGLVVLSSKKKVPFIADPKYLRHKGFKLADSADPYFELLYFPFDKTAKIPQFKKSVKERNQEKGMVLYYTAQCPFTAKYVPLIEVVANENDIHFKSVKIETTEEAQNAPSPFTTYSLFYNGKFVTHEILSENKFLKLVKTLGID